MTPLWTRLTDLDPDAVLLAGLEEAKRDQVRGTFVLVIGTLDASGDAGAAAHLSAILSTAPQVLTTAAGVQWLRTLTRAVGAGNADAYRACLENLARFEFAAALAAGTSWSGVLPAGWQAVPGQALIVESDGEAPLDVEDGQTAAPLKPLPKFGSVTIDPFDRSLQTVAAQEYALSGPKGLDGYAREVAAAEDLSPAISPTLFRRFRTTLVPIQSPAGVVSAATDEAAPWVTYCSFGREASDIVAALAHEELHATLNAVDSVLGERLPAGEGLMDVPWREGLRPLPAVLHGLAAFARASTVRSRALKAGAASSAMVEAAAREAGWVRTASDRLLGGALGALEVPVVQWIERNLEMLDSPCPAWPDEGLGVAAQSGAVSGFRWWLLRGGLGVDAASEAAQALGESRWPRATGTFSSQDRTDIDAATCLGPATMELLTRRVPAVILAAAGACVSLAAVKAHRLRRGDAIRSHTDGGHSTFAYRAVLGATVRDLAGGQLQFVGDYESAWMGVQPAFGDTLLFELSPSARHQVSEVADDSPRLTLVASYEAL